MPSAAWHFRFASLPPPLPPLLLSPTIHTGRGYEGGILMCCAAYGRVPACLFSRLQGTAALAAAGKRHQQHDTLVMLHVIVDWVVLLGIH